MAFRTLAPQGIHPPFSNYSSGVEIGPNQRMILCSGQLGIARDGTIAEGCEAQTRLCFDNIRAILNEGGMDLGDIARINAFVTGREHLAPYMAVRNALFAEPWPASTLMIVAGFARPEFVVEIEAIAVKA